MIERSLLLIKPNAVKHKHIGEIISILEHEQYRFMGMKIFRFDAALAARFYAEHRGKAFYNKLVEFMTSEDTVALILEKENAIHALRELIGSVEPDLRKPGTIRYLYGEGVTENGVHASDCLASAKREIEIIFGNQG